MKLACLHRIIFQTKLDQILGFDPIWFGILFCVNMQVSFLSPPFGPAAFYLKSVAPPHISLTDIFRGFAPFIVIQLIVLACVMFFPGRT